MQILFSDRAGAARFWLPLTLVAVLGAGAAMAQDETDASGEEPGVTEPGDPGEDGGSEPVDGGEWQDDPIAWTEPPVEPGDPEEYLQDDGAGEPVVLPDSSCDGCEAWVTGGERPVLENARGDTVAPVNRLGREGGECSEDGFLPLPWRCDW